MGNSKSRRKNYFIKKKFQTNFFLKFTGLLLLEGILIYAFFTYVSRGTLTAAYRGMDFTIQTTGSYFFTDFIVIFLLASALIGVMAVFIFILLSHRIGGALYRFEKTLELAKSGDFAQRVKLRENDELHDLNHEMNMFLETMDRRVADLKLEIETSLSELNNIKNDEIKSGAINALKRVKASLEQFKTSR